MRWLFIKRRGRAFREMLKKFFGKQPPSADRQRRLMGGLVDVFNLLEGKIWATIIGVVIMTILVVMSLLSFWL